MRYDKQRGGVMVWALLVFLVVGTWTGYQYGKAHVSHQALVEDVTSLTKQSLARRGRPLEELLHERFTSEPNIDMADDGMHIGFSPDGDKLQVQVNYSRQINLIFAHPKKCFDIYLEETSPRPQGVMGKVHKKVKKSLQQSYQRHEKGLDDRW